MILLLVLLFIVFLIFIYFLFAPFYLEVNTADGLYRIRFHWLISISLKTNTASPMLELRLMGQKKQIDLFSQKQTSKQKPIIAKQKKRKVKISLKKIAGMLKSFKINKCIIHIDSGDMQINGILYPLFYWISCYSKRDVRVNFLGENKMILEIENNLARMSWAYISS